MRYFNTEGCRRPNEHYMVCLDDSLRTIRKVFVEKGKYFVINSGRQYGKTTSLMALAEYLNTDYVVIHMDFQMMNIASVANERTFAVKFIRQIERYFSQKQKSMEGILQAVNFILKADLPLFGSMIKHVYEYPAIKKMLYDILFWGESISYNSDNRAIGLAGMFGYVEELDGKVHVSNRIFETRLYDYFLSEEELANEISGFSRQNKNQFIKGGKLENFSCCI